MVALRSSQEETELLPAGASTAACKVWALAVGGGDNHAEGSYDSRGSCDICVGLGVSWDTAGDEAARSTSWVLSWTSSRQTL